MISCADGFLRHSKTLEFNNKKYWKPVFARILLKSLHARRRGICCFDGDDGNIF